MKYRSLLLSFLIVLFFLGGVGLFALRAKAQGGPPATTICIILPARCRPPASGSTIGQIQKQVIESTTLKPGDTVVYQIQYQATRGANNTTVLSGCGGGGWVKIIDNLPAGFNYISANPTPTQRCPGPQSLVWDWTKLDSANKGAASGTIILTAQITNAACVSTGNNTITNTVSIIVAGTTSGSIQSQSSDPPVPITVVCPQLNVSGNVSSASADVAASSNLKIVGPSLVTAGGTIGIDCSGAEVKCINNYPIDLSAQKSVITSIINRLLKELAPACNLNLPLNGVCYKKSPPGIKLTGLSGNGTIIVNCTCAVEIGDNSNVKLGLIVNGSGKVSIAGSTIESMILYAPNSTVDFGVNRTLNLKGIFIANEFKSISQQLGAISFDSSLVKTPPPGMAQIIQPFIKENTP